MSLFNFKRRAADVDEIEIRKLGDKLLRDIKAQYPAGLRLKVTNKKALTEAGRAALTPDDELVIGG